MLSRYPHTGTIKCASEETGIDGIPIIGYEGIEVTGRFETTGKGKLKNVDYSGVFYCPVIDVLDFQVDGQKFIYQGKEFKIALLHNYQTHCEIWLE